MGFTVPQATSILRGSAPHNSFIGLALAAILIGPAGIDIADLATAILGNVELNIISR